MESRTFEESWKEAEYTQLNQVQMREEHTFTKGAVTKHDQILKDLHSKARNDPNTLGFLVIGSVATRTHHEKSDIDIITILRKNRPSSGINKSIVDGIIVDNLFFTYKILTESVNTVPYLLHTLVDSKLLFDPENKIRSLIEEVKEYFAKNPEIDGEWKRYYKQSKEVKQQTGCRARGPGANTIVDVWNELEKQYSGGKIKRPFFNAFYLTNPHIFSLVKRYLQS